MAGITPRFSHQWARMACLVAFSCLIPACISEPYHVSSEGLVIPDRGAKHLPFLGRAPDAAMLNYDALYVNWTFDHNGMPIAIWYRFWPDGRVAKGSTSTKRDKALTAADGDCLDGEPGWYALKGDAITLEFWTYALDTWQYDIKHGRVGDDGTLTLTSRQYPEHWHPLARSPQEIDETHLMRSVPGMKRKPTW